MEPANILLICSDRHRQGFFIKTLRQAGHNIRLSEASVHALELLTSLMPDVVILDTTLYGEDAYLLAEQLLQPQNQGRRPSLLMIVPDDDASVLRAFAAGADDCIGRVIPPILLRHRVQNLIKIRAQPGSGIPVYEHGKYRDLFRMANDAILVVDLITGQILDVNRRAERWLGYGRDKLLEMRYEDLIAPRKHQPTDKQVVEELSTRGHFIFEQNFSTGMKTVVNAEVSSRIFTFDGRKAMLNLVRDITVRKQLELTEREQRQLATSLIDTIAELNATLDSHEVLDRLLKHVTDVIKVNTTNVMLIDDQNPDQARIVAHRGYDLTEDAREIWQDRPWTISETANLRMMSEDRKPMLLNQVRTFADWIERGEIPIGSYIGAPIIARDRLIGFLNADDRAENRFRSSDASYLMAFANQAGIALENARLHEASKRHVDELEQRVQERTQQLVDANTQLKEQILERKRAEESMMEERNLLLTLVNNLPDYVFVKDLEGKFIMANDAFEQLVRQYNSNYTSVIGKTDDDYVDEELTNIYRNEDKRIIATGEPVINREVTRTLPDNDERNWLSTKVPLRDHNGEIIGIVAIIRDITELRKADAALKAEQTLLRTLFDHIPNEIYVKDLEGTIIMANRTITNRLGYRAPHGSVVGSNEWDFVYNEHTRTIAQRSIADEKRLMENGEGVIKHIASLTGQQGSMRWFETLKVPLKNADDEVIGTLGINRDITEEKRAEERISQIITGARCLLWYAIVEQQDDDFSWDVYISNEQAAQTFLPLNVPDDSTYVETWLQNIVAEDYADARQTCNQAIRDGLTENNNEYRCRRADGRLRWLNESIQINQLTPGRYSVVGVVTDITERREAAQTLQATNDLLEQRVAERTTRLSEANDLAEALIATAAALSQTLDLNKLLDRILTYARRVVPPHRSAEVLIIEDDIHVKPLRHLTYVQDGEVTSQETPGLYLLDNIPVLKRILDEGPVVIDDVTRDDTWVTTISEPGTRAYIGVPIRTEGRVIGFLHLTSDQPRQFTQDDAEHLLAFSNQAGIAIENARLFAAVNDYATTLETRIAERTRELEYERAQLHAILNAMTDGVVYHDTKEVPQYINQSLVGLTGFSMAEWLTGNVWPDKVSIDEEVSKLITTDAMADLMAHGIWHGEVQLLRKNGEIFDARLVTTSVSDTDGHFSGAVTVIRDVSAEKRLEAQKTRFIATASHELRTPITNMSTRLYLIEKQPDKTQEHLQVMNNVTKRMKKLVEDLLDMSRFQNGVIPIERCPVRLNALVEDVVNTQQPESEKRAIQLHATTLSYPLVIDADESRIMQVLTNLVMNALNYTPEGGEVEVSIDTAPGGPDAPHGWAIINVRDTGIGIATDLLPDVFKPFFRANDFNPGVGLGLSITREIIMQHDGEISVDSKLNEGTTFTVRLPLSEAPAIETD